MKTGTANYKGISFRRPYTYDAVLRPWAVRFTHKGQTTTSSAETERKAAIIYDKLCIKAGRPPVNVLKPVKK